MFRNILRRTAIVSSNIISAKKPISSNNSKSFSTDVESWVKIYKEMQSEAGKIADSSVGNVKSEVHSIKSNIDSVKSEFKSEISSVRSEISSVRSEFKSEIHSVRSEIAVVKSDIAGLKTDVAAVKADVAAVKTDLSNFKSDTYRQFSEVHKQATNNVRTILAGMFGIGSATVAVNQYLNTKKDDVSLLPTARKP